jgi:sugar phosphate isomerase/epimerase
VRAGINEFTTISASFQEDVAAYAAAGADAIGICELKLPGDDAEARSLLAEARLEIGACVPAVPSILPLPRMEGPESPEERVEALCASVRRLAAFEPQCILCLTGPAGERDDAEARSIVVDGLRRVSAEAAAAGVPFGVEPIQRRFAHFWTLVSSLDETAALLDEVGRDDVGILFDTWHLWNTDGVLDGIEREAARIVGVHVADWRDPVRNTDDRVFPGDGDADLPAILAALDGAGYDGLYEVEIFSDPELPDSLWNLPAGEAARRAVDSLRRVWHARPADGGRTETGGPPDPPA